jgi:hypothetical protein
MTITLAFSWHLLFVDYRFAVELLYSLFFIREDPFCKWLLKLIFLLILFACLVIYVHINYSVYFHCCDLQLLLMYAHPFFRVKKIVPLGSVPCFLLCYSKKER